MERAQLEADARDFPSCPENWTASCDMLAREKSAKEGREQKQRGRGRRGQNTGTERKGSVMKVTCLILSSRSRTWGTGKNTFLLRSRLSAQRCEELCAPSAPSQRSSTNGPWQTEALRASLSLPSPAGFHHSGCWVGAGLADLRMGLWADSVPESQNPTLVGVGRDLWGSPHPGVSKPQPGPACPVPSWQRLCPAERPGPAPGAHPLLTTTKHRCAVGTEPEPGHAGVFWRVLP